MDMTAEELLEAYARGERDFQAADLPLDIPATRKTGVCKTPLAGFDNFFNLKF
jgi:hypothetical protein